MQNEEHDDRWRFPDDAGPVRSFLFQIVESKSFGAIVLLVILFNTAVLLVQTDEEIRVKMGWWFSMLDFIFLAVYLVEAILKICALRLHYFSSGANKLDFIIVLVTLLDFILPLIVQNAGVLDVAALFKLVKVGRSIKAIRAVRVLRTIRFLKNLQVIFNTVMKSIRALSTIAFLAFLVVYMFAVIGRGLFYKLSAERFGNTYRAIVTLFQLMTLDDWFEVFQDVDESSVSCDNPPCIYSWLLLVYMIVFIFLQYFIFLNLLVAVIVDNFQRTLAAAEPNPKKSSLRRTAIFVAEDEESVSAVDDLTDFDQKSDSTIHKAAIEEFYTEDEVPDARDRQLLHKFFQNLTMLEYNIHQSHVQQKLLDDLVDITVAIAEVPEDLI